MKTTRTSAEVLQSMVQLLRQKDKLKLAVKLESIHPGRTRYLVVVSHPVVCKLPHYLLPTSQQQQPSPSHSSSEQSRERPLEQTQQIQREIQNVPITTNSTESAIHKQHEIPCDNNNIGISSDNVRNNEPPLAVSIDSSSSSSCSSSGSLSGSSQQTSSNGSQTQLNQTKLKEDLYTEVEESCLLGIDCNEKTTIGLVLKVMADTTIRLDGDGGFSVNACGRTHIFKPVSVQAMWSALQTLHNVSAKAREMNFFAGGSSHSWVSHYETRIDSEQSCLNEWNTMDSIESRRPPSPNSQRLKPTKREETECVIRSALKEIIMSVDLDEVTSKYIRGRLEKQLDMDLGEFKSFIDQEMLVILGQMDAPTEIFEHVYLGSEWNASNLEELQKNGVGHILNVTREIDNFFPGMFNYFNVRVYDDEKTDLLKYWDNTYRYINKAKDQQSKVLVHCKMGISRSASVVIAYAMKAYNWDFDTALRHVKDKRSCIKPNKNFLAQLEMYQGMLDAMKNKEKLQRSKSETNLKSTKDARLLPGSEPTPLIQALQGIKSQRERRSFEQRTEQRKRPRSWSPEMRKSACTRLNKPHSISLEHLVDAQRSVNCSMNLNKTILIPSGNGKTSYSVSQNHIVCLHDSSVTVPSVKTIIEELNTKTKDLNRRSFKMSKEVADRCSSTQLNSGGGSCSSSSSNNNNINNNNNSNNNNDNPDGTSTSSKHPVKSASAPSVAIRKDPDLFSSQVDRVFDREERRQHRHTNNPPTHVLVELADVSRNSSWSSVDSAVVLGDSRELPSRHSSFGSGDHRVSPSRNSSWGSYDIQNANTIGIYATTKPQPDQHHHRHHHHHHHHHHSSSTKENQCQQETDSRLSVPGTVKRSKQKLEEQTVTKRVCSPNSIMHKPSNRYSSEEILCGRTNIHSSAYNRLSASAPENNFLSPSVRALHSFNSVDESEELKTVSEGGSTGSGFKGRGMVKNLKMKIEAQVAQINNKTSSSKDKKGHSSLPSSPVHTDSNQNQNQPPSSPKNAMSKSASATTAAAMSATLTNNPPHSKSPPDQKGGKDKDTLDDISVRNLVDKYEVKETKARGISYRNSFPSSKKSGEPRRRPQSVSVFETRLNINLSSGESTAATKPLILSRSAAAGFLRNDADQKRPPIPQNSQKLSVSAGSGHVLTRTNNNNNNNNNSGARRFLQHGKTHPLARLEIKQKIGASYNTM